MSRKEALSQFINQIHGRPVVVKLNSGVDYRGKYLKIELNLNIQLFCVLRCIGMPGWIYEHCARSNRRIREWTIKK